MKRSSMGFILFIGLLSISLLSIPPQAQGGGDTSFYAGVVFPYILPITTGDFNGQTYFESETELFLVPKIKGGYGFEALAGVRIDMDSKFLQGIAGDAVYHRTNHQYSFFEAEAETTKASFNEFLLNIRAYLGKKKFIQPLAYLEMGFSLLTVKNGAYTYTTPREVGDAKYTGVNFGLGLGAELSLPVNFALQLRAGYHLIIMEDVRGVTGERYQVEKITATFPKLTVGLVFYIRPRTS